MILSCQHIKKSFGDNDILYDVNFQIEDRDKYAIVGSNGSGKSTLLKIIVGQLGDYSGDVVIAKDTRLGYLAQYQEDSSNQTILDVVLSACQDLCDMEKLLESLGLKMANCSDDPAALDEVLNRFNKLQDEFNNLGGLTFRSEAVGILKGLGFTEEEFTKTLDMLSGGEATRVFLGKLLISKPDLLILDEPINHLDLSSIEWLEGYLANYNSALIIVAHDRYFLDKIVDHVVDLDDPTNHVYKGNYSKFITQKEAMLLAKMNEYNKQQKEIAHQEAVIDKLQQFNREKSISRAESRKKTLDKMEVIDKPINDSFEMKLHFNPARRSGNDVLSVEHISCIYPDGIIFRDLSFFINNGDKVAILGDNGTGKTTILKMVTGHKEASEGTIKLGSQVDIGYYDQAQMNLVDTNTIFQEIADTYPKMTQTDIRNNLAAFGFTADDVYKQISLLSGGERGRVSLCKLMLSDANFLILDEPTNHLDMESKSILESAINDYDGTVLFVSHDRYFINQCATKIIELKPEIGLTEYLGNYDYYLYKKDQIQQDNYIGSPKEEVKTEAKLSWEEDKAKKAAQRKLDNQIASIEKRIDELEAEIASIDAEFDKPEVQTNSAKLNELSQKRGDLETELEELMNEWEEICS